MSILSEKLGSSTLLAKVAVVGAALLFAAGVAGSFVTAHVVARSDAHAAQHRFAASSADISAQFSLVFQHEADLLLGASAFILSDRRLSETTFARWSRADQIAARYPEVVGVERIVLVQATQLEAFRERAGSSFVVTPAGARPPYCLVDLNGLEPARRLPEAAGFDSCAGPAGAALLRSRDTGQGTYRSASFGKTSMLAVETPLYRGETVPASAAARRKAFAGWLEVALTPEVVVKAALKLHPGTAITLRFGGGASAVAFTGGKAPADGQSARFDLGHGWVATTSGARNSGGLLANRNALVVLAGGIVLSLLLTLLGAVLATGRARAVLLVDKQTAKLLDQTATLRTTLADLEAAQAVKDQFLGLVSHELRTPLTSIKGYTELLREDELGPEVESYLDVIGRNAERLLGLVEDVLLMAQIQNGELPLKIGEVILNDLLRRCGETARPFAASKDIDIDIQVEPGIATRGDSIRLGQAVDNLVSNAIKYTPEHGDVAIKMTREGETATIEVSDTGIGIPALEQDQMFGRFFRTSNARESGIEGTGLGLAISREIIEAHGGTISFDSAVGTGTTFRITLPHAHDANLESAA